MAFKKKKKFPYEFKIIVLNLFALTQERGTFLFQLYLTVNSELNVTKQATLDNYLNSSFLVNFIEKTLKMFV